MTEMIPFDNNTTAIPSPEKLALMSPDERKKAAEEQAKLAALFGGSNIQSGETVPGLSIRGKVWKIVKDGNETALMTKTPDGEFPMPTVKVVVVGQTPGRARTYFEGKYVEGENRNPDCSSYDGVRPATDAETPFAPNCASCDNAVKGSEISPSGYATTKCKANKFLAIVPSNDLQHDILRLKLPITSIFDKENAEESQGWYAWDQYMKFIKSRGVSHTGQIETTMKFDASSDWPKVLFRATGQLPVASMTIAAERSQSEDVTHILGLDKVRTEDAVVEMVAEAEEPAPEPEAAKPAPVATATVPVKKAAPKKVAPAKKAAPVQEVVQETAPVAEPEVAPEPAADVPVVDNDDDLQKIMADWS